jgi:hypothetical protein
MDEVTKLKMEEMEIKIDAIYKSVERTRKYIKWALIISVLTIVIPLIGSIILTPFVLSSLNSYLPSP